MCLVSRLLTAEMQKMTYLKLQEITVLFVLLSFVLRPVQSIETGYRYSAEDVVGVDRHIDLKCGYVYSGITQMRLIQKIFGYPNGTVEQVMYALSAYNRNVKYQIATLYELEGVNIGALFVLHLYTSMVASYYEDIKKKMTGEMVKWNIFTLHNYVTEKLSMEVFRCRKAANVFDWVDYWAAQEHVPSLRSLNEFIKIKSKQMFRLLQKNNESGQLMPYGMLIGALRPEVLLLTNFVFVPNINRNLLNNYAVQVRWTSTREILTNAHKNATTLEWTVDNLRGIRHYYRLIFAVFKVIMFRLVWKYLHYIHNIASVEPVQQYTEEWYTIINDFGKTLQISNDPQIKHMLVGLDEMTKSETTRRSFYKSVREVLGTFNLILGCEADVPYEIRDSEFSIRHGSSRDKHYFIERNSLEFARAFLSKLNNVNFRIIRLLRDYIVANIE